MPRSPFFKYIQVYFPQDQRENADCISTHECSPDRDGYPDTCIAIEPQVKCDGTPASTQRRSWGVFQIFDSCWSPYMNPASPFSEEQWDNRMSPNINTWMASKIWGGGGWRAWSTSGACGVSNVPGGPIPHPRAPLTEEEIDVELGEPPLPSPLPPGSNIVGLVGSAAPIVLGLGCLIGAVLLAKEVQKG